MSRESVILPDRMSEQVIKYAKKWGVSKGEAMRRLFGMGVWVADTHNKKTEIYTKKKGADLEKIVFLEAV